MAEPVADERFSVRLHSVDKESCRLEITGKTYGLRQKIKFKAPWYCDSDKRYRPVWSNDNQSWVVTYLRTVGAEDADWWDYYGKRTREWLRTEMDAIKAASSAKRSASAKASAERRRRHNAPTAEELTLERENFEYFQEHGNKICPSQEATDAQARCPSCLTHLFSCKQRKVYDRAMSGCWSCGRSLVD